MDISKLRVLQISAAYLGAQKQIEDAIYDELQEHGVSSRILYCVGESNNPDYIKYETCIENYIRRFCNKYIKKSYVFSRQQTKRLIRIIDSYKPNIVHIHTIHHGFVHYPLLFDYLRRKEIKTIFTAHDMWLFTGGCYYYTDLQCSGFTKGCKDCHDIAEQHDCEIKETAKLFELKKKCYEGLNIRFVAVSNWVKGEIKKSFLKGYPLYMIPNCIYSKDRDENSEITINKDIVEAMQKYKTIVFVAASWDKRKGYDTICDLSVLLGNDYRIIVVGNVKKELKKRAGSNMLFTGYIKSKNDLNYLYRFCNLHASASKEETFGMTFIEAAFEGTRSIGFGCTAVKETITGAGGICVQAGDLRAFYNAICKHVDDEKLSIEEVNAIKKRYSKRSMSEAYIKVYQKC